MSCLLMAAGWMPAAQAAPTRIMLLGDSITTQGDARRPLYEYLTAEGYSFEFVGSQGGEPLKHEGHSGFTIGPDPSKPGNLYDNIAEWIPAAKPDIIFLLIGNNDFNVMRGVDSATSPQRLAGLLDKIHGLAPDAVVVVSTVLKIAIIDDYAGDLNRAMPGIVEKQAALGRRVYFADLHNEVDLQKGSPPYNQPGGDYVDGTHLNASGGKKLADGWYNHLIPYLGK